MGRKNKSRQQKRAAKKGPKADNGGGQKTATAASRPDLTQRESLEEESDDEECNKLSFKDMTVKEYKAPKLSTDKESLTDYAAELLESYPGMLLPNRANPISPRRRKELTPRTAAVLKNYLISHPEYDSHPGYGDSHREWDSGFHETFHAHLMTFPEIKAILLNDGEARAMCAGFFRWLKDRKPPTDVIVDEGGLRDFAEQFMEDAIAQNDFLEAFHAVRHRIYECVLETLKSYVLKHPKYNSFRGVNLLRNNNGFQILSNVAFEEVRKEYLAEFLELNDEEEEEGF